MPKTILRSLLWKLLLDSGRCTNSSESGEQGNKVKAKEVEVWNQKRLLLSDVYAGDLIYVFMDEMNLLY